jgi:hypothetical protein
MHLKISSKEIHSVLIDNNTLVTKHPDFLVISGFINYWVMKGGE